MTTSPRPRMPPLRPLATPTHAAAPSHTRDLRRVRVGNTQVGEASFFTYHPVVEAHVRLYAVLHEEARTQGREFSAAGAADAPDRAFFQTRVMRLTNPNDELGGMMFLPTPQTVSHRIDRWSPMFPPAARFNTSHEAHDGDAYHFPGLVFREADREVAVLTPSPTPARLTHAIHPALEPSVLPPTELSNRACALAPPPARSVDGLPITAVARAHTTRAGRVRPVRRRWRQPTRECLTTTARRLTRR
jgi:hypothetical protein